MSAETDNGKTIRVTNPADGTVVGTVPVGTAADVSAAVDNASGALGKWSSLLPRERGKILFNAATAIRQDRERLATLLTSEQGKPLAEAKNEIMGCANVFEYYASISGSIKGDAFPRSDYGYSITIKKPLGVCGAIIPWNMPALIMAWKTGPALVAGNALIVKPATSTPLTCMEMASVIRQAGIPEEILRIIPGSGEEVGSAIAAHPGIRAVSFTGSTETGRKVESAACGTGKHLTLELGGSDPMIVCDDADIPAAVAGAVAGRFYNCGQTCTAVKRLFLFEDIADEFTAALEAGVAGIKIGNGLSPGVRMGPMNNGSGRERIKELVEGIRESGDGTILTGGEIPKGGEYEKGYFYEPTIVTGVPAGSPLMREEVFGPVLPVSIVSGMNEAIEAANSVRYGLGASVWTESISRAAKAAEEIEAGIVWVNRHLKIPPEVPFGGEKASGTGRENGIYAPDRYMTEKTVIISP
ncbi:MAG: aldehyde dehydrogenase [Methanomicrobiaceae archaeon]|nr:aldehyde dehydrogenase [Methanomicrobiaceae archaeon]